MKKFKFIVASSAIIVVVCILFRGCFSSGGELLLVDAAQRGDLVLVQQLLNSGVSPNSEDSGTSALIAATRAGGHIKVMQALLEKGARVDAKATNGYTPLLCAATTDVDEIALLLRCKADINAVDVDGHTSLMIDAENAETDIVKVLLLDGASVDIEDKTGQTALMKVASIQYDVPAINIAATATALIAHGAGVNDKDRSGQTPLALAVENKHTQLELILKNAGARR